VNNTPSVVDIRRMLIPVSAVVVAVTFVAASVWRVAQITSSTQAAINNNTVAVQRLDETIRTELLRRSEFDRFIQRLQDLNPELQVPPR